jgi:hypothetical protein
MAHVSVRGDASCCYSVAINLDTTIYQQSRPSKSYHGSRFGRTTRVMSVLLPRSLAHWLSSNGLEGSGMGMISDNMRIQCRVYAVTMASWLKKQRTGSRSARTTSMMNLRLTCSHTEVEYVVSGGDFLCIPCQWCCSKCLFGRFHCLVQVLTLTRWVYFEARVATALPKWP